MSGQPSNKDDLVRDDVEAEKFREELAHFRASIAESRAQAERGESGPLDVDAVMRRLMLRLSGAK